MGLKELRETKGLTRKELIELTGINLRSLQDYEQGHKSVLSMKSESLYRLSLALDCTMEDILEDYLIEIEVYPGVDLKQSITQRKQRLLAYSQALQSRIKKV